MKMLFKKPLSEIKSEKEQAAIEPLLDIYEAIASIGEELEAVRAENEELKARVTALEGVK